MGYIIIKTKGHIRIKIRCINVGVFPQIAVEKAANSNWTKPAWEKLMQFRQDFGDKQKFKKVTRLKRSNGDVSKSVAEDLQVSEIKLRWGIHKGG